MNYLASAGPELGRSSERAKVVIARRRWCGGALRVELPTLSTAVVRIAEKILISWLGLQRWFG